jgi:hypothetical protein
MEGGESDIKQRIQVVYIRVGSEIGGQANVDTLSFVGCSE